MLQRNEKNQILNDCFCKSTWRDKSSTTESSFFNNLFWKLEHNLAWNPEFRLEDDDDIYEQFHHWWFNSKLPHTMTLLMVAQLACILLITLMVCMHMPVYVPYVCSCVCLCMCVCVWVTGLCFCVPRKINVTQTKKISIDCSNYCSKHIWNSYIVFDCISIILLFTHL